MLTEKLMNEHDWLESITGTAELVVKQDRTCSFSHFQRLDLRIADSELLICKHAEHQIFLTPIAIARAIGVTSLVPPVATRRTGSCAPRSFPSARASHAPGMGFLRSEAQAADQGLAGHGAPWGLTEPVIQR